MRKIWIIAVREYLATVRTKAFIVSILMMPILMGGSIFFQHLQKRAEDKGEKTFAVIDRTPDQQIFKALEVAVEKRNKSDIFDPLTKEQDKPRFKLVSIPPSAPDRQHMLEQRYELSQQVLHEEYYGFLEVGANVLDPGSRSKQYVNEIGQDQEAQNPDFRSDEYRLRYQSKHPTYREFSAWAEKEVNRAIQKIRWTGEKESPEKIQTLMETVPLASKGLAEKDPRTGEIQDAATVHQELQYVIPAALIAVMFMMVMVGATPLVSSVLEEKMQRIAEVLLGSVRPFELMTGKLLGAVGISLTICGAYLGGAYWAAYRYDVTILLPASLIAWFFVYLVLAILMFGSMFIAVGAASTEAKDAQTLIMPVFMPAMIPMFMLPHIIQQPNSWLSTSLSFFPLSAPMLMIARISVPPGIPWWQPALGIVDVLAATALCVYVAGRIFRVGLLSTGKGARIGEMLRWALRG